MKQKSVLLACEFSGVVREAFKRKGWRAVSCDLLPTEIPGEHYQGNVLDIINDGWDAMICFPPCTYLAVSGNAHFKNNPERWKKQLDAALFAYSLFNASIEYIGLENPISVLSSYIGQPSQIINPYYFGDPIPKKTALWLKNLPPLTYSLTNTLFEEQTAVDPEYYICNSSKTKSGKSKTSFFHKMRGGKGKERSVFHKGIAEAMAEQWTNHINGKSDN